ncbi:acyltransferase [Patescibacteria group bacterium]|nr:acyltransferase [Patescibacteria group bacterium]
MSIADPVFATYIFAAILFVVLLVSARPRKLDGFSPEVVQELKGFAIIAIVLSHIGYFLVSDHRFLAPLSSLAGVGVDLFLLVSGFGLAASALKTVRKPLEFYKRRLDKLFTPLWSALAIFFTMDFFILGKTYSLDYIARSFVGLFPSADVYTDINSPLWYITLILFFYLIFPLLFIHKRPLVSAGLVFATGYALTSLQLPFFSAVAHLHELHVWAFPVGMAIAGLLKGREIGKEIGTLPPVLYALSLLGTAGAFFYFAGHSNVGAGVFLEQGTSITIALLLCLFFVIKKFEVRLLYLFGIFSYEIYLFHWPIMSRYDMFFKFLPQWLAVLFYLALFLALGWLFQEIQKRISKLNQTKIKHLT